MRTVRAALRPIAARLVTWDPAKRRLVRAVLQLGRLLGRDLKPRAGRLIDEAFVDGAPAGPEELRQVYWRKRVPPPADPDPDRDRCGRAYVRALALAPPPQIHSSWWY